MSERLEPKAKTLGEIVTETNLKYAGKKQCDVKSAWLPVGEQEKWVREERLVDAQQRLAEQATEHHNCVMQTEKKHQQQLGEANKNAREWEDKFWRCDAHGILLDHQRVELEGWLQRIREHFSNFPDMYENFPTLEGALQYAKLVKSWRLKGEGLLAVVQGEGDTP